MAYSGAFTFLRILNDKFRGTVKLSFDIKYDPNGRQFPSLLASKLNREIRVERISENSELMRKGLTINFLYKNRINSKWSWASHNRHTIYPVFEAPPRVTVYTEKPMCTPIVSCVAASSFDLELFYNYSPSDRNQVNQFLNDLVDLRVFVEGRFVAETIFEKIWNSIYSLLLYFFSISAVYSILKISFSDFGNVDIFVILFLSVTAMIGSIILNFGKQ